MTDFDERDLARWFLEAGFSQVRMSYEVTLSQGAMRASPSEIYARLRQRPNPVQPSYEEAARAVLGDEADAYLDRYVELIRSQPGRSVNAAAYVTAIKPRP